MADTANASTLSEHALDRLTEGFELVMRATDRQAALSTVILSLIYGFTPDTPEGWEFYKQLRTLAALLNEIANEAQGELQVLDKVLSGDLF